MSAPISLVDEQGNAKEEYVLGFLDGVVETSACYVSTGCKPMATCLIRTRHVERAKQIVAHTISVAGAAMICRAEQREPPYETWTDLTIYRSEMMARIDEEFKRVIPQEASEGQSTAFWEWVRGKLFGYGQIEIEEWIDWAIDRGLPPDQWETLNVRSAAR